MITTEWTPAERGNNFRTKREIGIFTHNGREYKATGAVIAEKQIVGYVHGEHLTAWRGEIIMKLNQAGFAKGLHGTALHCYNGSFGGYNWYGKGLGEGMVLRLVRGRRV